MCKPLSNLFDTGLEKTGTESLPKWKMELAARYTSIEDIDRPESFKESKYSNISDGCWILEEEFTFVFPNSPFS